MRQELLTNADDCVQQSINMSYSYHIPCLRTPSTEAVQGTYWQVGCAGTLMPVHGSYTQQEQTAVP